MQIMFKSSLRQISRTKTNHCLFLGEGKVEIGIEEKKPAGKKTAVKQQCSSQKFSNTHVCSVSALQRSAFKGLSKELLWQRNDSKEVSLEQKPTEKDFSEFFFSSLKHI